jgi:hypothetical protein
LRTFAAVVTAGTTGADGIRRTKAKARDEIMSMFDYIAAHPWWTLTYLWTALLMVVGAADRLGALIQINSGMNSGQKTYHKD